MTVNNFKELRTMTYLAAYLLGMASIPLGKQLWPLVKRVVWRKAKTKTRKRR